MPSYKERPCGTFATLPRTTRGVPIVLGDDPKGKNFLYTNDRSVIIRDIENPGVCDIYTEHSYPVSVAKYAPSGYYIASGDSTGKIRIWDTTSREHILKNEFSVLGGGVKDIAWDGESKRIAVAGEGKESYAKCITADSGNTLGSLAGHSKTINSIAYKPNRPFRIATGGEDFTAQLFEGPPFKRKCEKNDHSNFVQSVRFSPDGEVFVTGGSDGKALIYDGKSGDLLGCLGGTGGETDAKAHSGGIYAVAFSPNGKEVLTVSGDKMAKIWDLASRQLVQEFLMGKDINDMQLGCLWSKDNIITVSLSGFINYLDRNNPSQPRKILKGHNKPIMAMALNEDKTHIYSGAADGQIFCWDASTGLCEPIQGKGHSNQVQKIVVKDDTFVTIGMDDTIRYNNARRNEYSSDSTKLPSLPKAVALMSGGTAVVACVKHIVVVQNGRIMFELQTKYEALSVDIHPGGTIVAVGGSDRKIHIFELQGPALQEVASFPCGEERAAYDHAQEALDLKYSPDGAYLAAVGSEKNVILYKYEGPNHPVVGIAKRHTGRIDSVAWSPDSQHCASGSLDQSIIVWSLEDFTKVAPSPLTIKNAHKMSQVTGLAWLSSNILVSCGRDSNIKQWEISF